MENLPKKTSRARVSDQLRFWKVGTGQRLHKVAQITRLAERCGKAGVGFTTTYRTWKEAAARQGKHQNIAYETFIWILGDPAKQFKVTG